jgi:uncharacterized protein
MTTTITLHNETLTLLPERAAYWERTNTLFIADLHVGKTATFRAHAIPLPEGDTSADLDRLTRVLHSTDAEKLIILGDLFHAASGLDASTLGTVATWRDRHPDVEILLVRGNHDKGAGDPPDSWNFRTVDGPTPGPMFVLTHKPMTPEHGYALAGHLHPAVQLTGKGRQMLKLPCFWFGTTCGVLPAFGSFTGTALITPQPVDQIFVIAGDKVLQV